MVKIKNNELPNKDLREMDKIDLFITLKKTGGLPQDMSFDDFNKENLEQCKYLK